MRGRAAGGEAKADARAGAAGRRAIARTRSGRSLRSARMMRTRHAGLRKREALARRFRRDRIDQAMCDLRFGLLSFDPQLAKRTQRTDASCGPSRGEAAARRTCVRFPFSPPPGGCCGMPCYRTNLLPRQNMRRSCHAKPRFNKGSCGLPHIRANRFSDRSPRRSCDKIKQLFNGRRRRASAPSLSACKRRTACAACAIRCPTKKRNAPRRIPFRIPDHAARYSVAASAVGSGGQAEAATSSVTAL